MTPDALVRLLVGRPAVVVTLDAMTAFALVATLQLVLCPVSLVPCTGPGTRDEGLLNLARRHPQNVGETAALMRQLAPTLIDVLAPAPGPLRALLEAGWDPAHDVPADGGAPP